MGSHAGKNVRNEVGKQYNVGTGKMLEKVQNAHGSCLFLVDWNRCVDGPKSIGPVLHFEGLTRARSWQGIIN